MCAAIIAVGISTYGRGEAASDNLDHRLIVFSAARNVPQSAPTTVTATSTIVATATPTAGPSTPVPCGVGTTLPEITALDKAGETVVVTGHATMTGWYLISVAGAQRFNFPAGFVLSGSVTIVSNSPAFASTPTRLWWSTSNFWNNSMNDDAQLFDCAGHLIDTFDDGD
ncbi:hypothetical protein AYO38_03700 [bacterium SCGC AG-212-C10]|nr:hypothetical protein AYO38_03700 [bacterium SCGC AG-212-C10]